MTPLPVVGRRRAPGRPYLLVVVEHLRLLGLELWPPAMHRQWQHTVHGLRPWQRLAVR